MRLFAGIFPPPEALEEIGRVQETLRAVMKGNVRWVPRERMHLTLRFYGDDAELERTREHFYKAIDNLSAFSIRLVEVSGFPNPKNARVVFLAPEYHKELFELAGRFEDNPQGRVTPHLTLARLEKRGEIPTVSFAPISFEVKEIVLVHSLLGGGKPRYEILETKVLEVSPPVGGTSL